MVDILWYLFRFAEASEKKSYGPNKQVHNHKKILLLLAYSCWTATNHLKKQAWARDSLCRALSHGKSCPGIPGELSGPGRVPVGCQAGTSALLCLHVGLCFYTHCYYKNLHFDHNRMFPSTSVEAWKSTHLFWKSPGRWMIWGASQLINQNP